MIGKLVTNTLERMWKRTFLPSFELFTGSSMEHLRKPTNNLGPGRRSVGHILFRHVQLRIGTTACRTAMLRCSFHSNKLHRHDVGHIRDTRLHVQCITRTQRRVSPYEKSRLRQKWGHIILLPFSRLRTSRISERKADSCPRAASCRVTVTRQH